MAVNQEIRDRNYKYIHKGLVLSRPVDLLQEGEYAILQNIRSYFEGVLQSRPGILAVNSIVLAGAAPIHTIKRLNDDVNNAFLRIIGSGSSLFAGTDFTTVAQRSSLTGGFSGNPLSVVPFRPSQSPIPYGFIADSLRLVKIRSDRTVQLWGIAPPTSPPTVALAQPNFSVPVHTTTTAGWNQIGDAGGPSSQNRVNTTINRILFDSGATGWACIEPVSMNNIGKGMLVGTLGGNSDIPVHEVYRASGFTSTPIILGIVYDSGNTGPCTIRLSGVSKDTIVPDAMLLISGVETVRVQSVSYGPDEEISIRVNTTSPRVAGNTVSVLNSFRAFLPLNATAGGAITTKAVQSTLTFSTGIGRLDQTATGVQEWGVIPHGIGPHLTQDIDKIHFSLQVDHPERVTELKLLLDVDPTGTNDFTKNFYFASFRVSDITGISTDRLNTLNARIERLRNKIVEATNAGRAHKAQRLRDRQTRLEGEVQKANTPIFTDLADGDFPTQGQISAGATQWTDVVIDFGDLTKVGTQVAGGLNNIQKQSIQLTVTGDVVVQIAHIWIEGTAGPDVGKVGTPYRYTYRYRNYATGEVSGHAPFLRSGINPHRQAVSLTPTLATDTQVDLIDWFRNGGTLNEWIYIGSQPNSSIFTDAVYDDEIINNFRLETDNRQPFAVLDSPFTCQVNVAGTAITRVSGSLFNTSWGQNTPILINGKTYRIYQVTSTTLLHTYEAIGNFNNITLRIPEPLLIGQPLSNIWGPWGEGEAEPRIFACGDTKNPGQLYYTKPGRPGEHSDGGYLEITNPSEPLMNGCIFDGQCFVASNRRWFFVRPSGNLDIPFTANDLPFVKGLFAKWGLAVGPMIFFIGEDGIYATNGNALLSLTDEQLYPIFPHDGQPGVASNGFNPPDFSQPNAMNLEYVDDFLYFNYMDTGGSHRTAVYKLDGKRWESIDTYNPSIGVHYREEGRSIHDVLMGGVDGRLYQYSGTSDNNGTGGPGSNLPIAIQVRTGSMDMGEPRANKRFYDIWNDIDPAGSNLTLTVGYDNFTTTEIFSGATGLTGGSRSSIVRDLGSGFGVLARNVAIDLQTASGVIPKLYGWGTRFTLQPPDTINSGTDALDLGYAGPKFFQGVRITADTHNIAKTFKVQSDTGPNGAWQDQQTFTITHDGVHTEELSFDTPFIAHLVRVIGNDPDTWELHTPVEFIFEIDSPLATHWWSQSTTSEGRGFQHFRDGYIAHISTTNVTLRVTLDGVSYDYIIPSSGGAFHKDYFPFKSIKFKSVQYELFSSAEFRLYRKACEVRRKIWGSPESYEIIQPFGEIHNNVPGPRV